MEKINEYDNLDIGDFIEATALEPYVLNNRKNSWFGYSKQINPKFDLELIITEKGNGTVGFSSKFRIIYIWNGKIIAINSLHYCSKPLTKEKDDINKRAKNFIETIQNDTITTSKKTLKSIKNYYTKIPISKGGTNTLENLVPLCRSCHEQLHGFKFENGNINEDRKNYGKETPTTKIGSKEHIICDAIENNYRIKIRYKSGKADNYKVTERIIRPISLELGAESSNSYVKGSSYDINKTFLKAFCELRNAERLFRLDRIEKIIEVIK